jgi:hypothetical protein
LSWSIWLTGEPSRREYVDDIWWVDVVDFPLTAGVASGVRREATDG